MEVDGVPPLLRGHAVELSERLARPVTAERCGNQVLIVVVKHSLPEGIHNVRESDVLLLSDIQYPSSSMDMFFLEEHVTLRGGHIPSHASSVVEYGGRRWRQWSWHRNGRWTPGVDDLLSHWAFVESCWGRELRDAPPRS